MPRPVPDPGRANAIGCSGYLPGAEGTCTWATDPRGAGLAIGSN
jgi:gamma-glutamyltranspeptidase/glutathione hydrolase